MSAPPPVASSQRSRAGPIAARSSQHPTGAPCAHRRAGNAPVALRCARSLCTTRSTAPPANRAPTAAASSCSLAPLVSLKPTTRTSRRRLHPRIESSSLGLLFRRSTGGAPEAIFRPAPTAPRSAPPGDSIAATAKSATAAAWITASNSCAPSSCASAAASSAVVKYVVSASTPRAARAAFARSNRTA